MPRISDMMPSKFLKKEDVEDGIAVTIKDILELNVARDDSEEEMKWCALFREFPKKPMVLNSTNLQLISHVLGSDDSDDWIDKKIVLYNDPSVSFAGKLTGGIRVRAMKKKPVVSARTREPGDDDVEIDAELEPVV